MIIVTVFDTGQPCPECGTALTVFDDGTSPARLECCWCGYAEAVPVDGPDRSGQ